MKREDELLIDLIEKIENSQIKWEKPWTSLFVDQTNFTTMKEYSGINILLLTVKQIEMGYELPLWAGFNQLKKLNLYVRKGEKGTIGLRVNTIKRVDEQGNESIIRLPSSFTVFNIDQCENSESIKANYRSNSKPLIGVDEVDQVIKGTGAIIKPGTQACYYPAFDHIEMPSMSDFKSVNHYYATLFHELIHWTKHDKRLNRNLEYAIEECVAELGAVMCMNRLDLESDSNNHAAYLSSWLSAVKEKPRLLMSLMSKASDARKFIFNELNHDE